MQVKTLKINWLQKTKENKFWNYAIFNLPIYKILSSWVVTFNETKWIISTLEYTEMT